MLNLDPETVLQVAPSLSLSIHSGTSIQAFLNGRRIDCGRRALAVLDAFSRPTSLGLAAEALKSRACGAEDWVELTSTIVRFVEAGVLRDERQVPVTIAINPFTFDGAGTQVAMLNDRVRTARFMAAIREVVRPGDVVVEIGTGTGILAITAARAGARHVYAIEAGAIGRVARAVLAANALADRITLVQGWSAEVTLPEPGDVLVSEIIGNDPLNEGVLEFTADAMRRLVKPDARLIPARLRIFGLPVTIPRERLQQRTFAKETVRSWQAWYEIDFSPLFEAACKSPHFFFMRPQLARDWPSLSEPILFADVDLKDIKRRTISTSKRFTTTASGNLNGLLVYFELDVGPTTRVSTHPAKADEYNCWNSPVWMFPDEFKVAIGETLEASYSYRVPGNRNGVAISKDRNSNTLSG